ncbi:protein kinase domain-containing protein [Streptomyces viridochromogenes]|uniref:protein kinase domain-containing protein n=1 Tax=Streptomyces viridochromogenes TaxID=1938 RepID=UPI001F25B478|nr:protein kinase [Streptomyces viridochromogenes]
MTHRDLKPRHVILPPQGQLLIDFGIARGAADTALTQTGLAPGTPGYTAPEVLISDQVGAAADVFALGRRRRTPRRAVRPSGPGPRTRCRIGWCTRTSTSTASIRNWRR